VVNEKKGGAARLRQLDRKGLLGTRRLVPARCRVMSDDLVFDLVVGSLRNDLFCHQLVFRRVRTSSDYGFGVCVAYSGQRLQLIFRRRVDVELIGRCRLA